MTRFYLKAQSRDLYICLFIKLSYNHSIDYSVPKSVNVVTMMKTFMQNITVITFKDFYALNVIIVDDG